METKKPIALLLSKVGRGKTCFFNKICTQSKKTQFGGSSCTREIFLKCSSFGKGFYLMDTPGFGCDEDIITHLSALFVAAERPLNAILILTKFDRSCVMKEEINQALSMLSQCREIIIVIVTFWDDVEKEPQESQDKLKSDIEDQVMKPLKLKSFICTSKSTTGDLICSQLDQLIQNNVKRSVQLTPQEFSFQFSKHTLFSIQDELETHKLKQAFQNKCEVVLKFIQQQPDNSEKTSDLMHEIILLIKKEAHKTVMEFTNQNRDKFEELVEKFGICEYTYLAHTKLKAEIMGTLEQVKQIAMLKMQTYQFHCYNFIKKCPNCGLIWYKVSGCDGVTSCGKILPEKDEPKHTPKPKRYQVIFNGYDLEIIENIQINNQSKINDLTIINEQSNNNDQNQGLLDGQSNGLLGCGIEFNWKETDSLTEQEIIDLRDTGYLDMLCMVQDKDSKDIENEKRYLQKIEEQQMRVRESLNRQIEAENNNFEQIFQQKEKASQNEQFNEERKNSDQQIAISYIQQENNQTSFKDDAKIQNDSCSISTCNIS